MLPEFTFENRSTRDPTAAAFQRFFSAQLPETRANMLAFLHLSGATEVRQADVYLGRSGAMRLVIRVKLPDDLADALD